MVSHHVFSQLVLFALIWLFIILHLTWPKRPMATPATPTEEPEPLKPKRHGSNEPKPFEGLTQKPHCALCERDTASPQVPPPVPPDPMSATNRRPREVDTSRHFCPHAGCPYRGWRGLGNLRANGHPSGGPWRQFHCTSCKGYFPETHGTLFHGKQAAVDLIVRVLACLAEGLGIRATARVFEVAPNTVLQWLVEAAEQLRAFSAYFLCDLHLEQLQLDELYAVLRALKAGEISEDAAIKRLERSPSWVWTAMDPKSKLLVVVDVGCRTLAMAQRVVHQVTRVLAPGCVPLFLTDGLKDYATALLTHFGHWIQPQRRQDKGPMPKPRWMPLPALLYAQVVKSYRRRRIVGVTHRVVFGTQLAIEQVLAACGWTINTAFVERLNLDIRQCVAAIGRRVNTLCQGETGLRDQLALFQVYHNFVLPHASLRQPLLVPEATNGRGSAKLWRPCTPAMAAGLTDHVWSLKEVLLYRVPPWPQLQVG
jgi:transposase-like protein/IS1 family transposase